MACRRTFVRVATDGLARVEHGGALLSFRLVDMSYGGIGLRGETTGLRVGSLVRVMVTMASGNRLDTCPILETRAVVKHLGTGELGLAWCPTVPERAGDIALVVDDAIRTART